MSAIDEIMNALGAKHISGLSLEPERKPAPAPSRPAAPLRSAYVPPVATGAPKIFPSDRMMLRNGRDTGVMPARPAIMMSTYTDDDLEWMFSTPAKRGWEFSDWLEVVGLPRDLNEQHDRSIYGYAARAFLRLKRESHQR